MHLEPFANYLSQTTSFTWALLKEITMETKELSFVFFNQANSKPWTPTSQDTIKFELPKPAPKPKTSSGRSCGFGIR